MCTLLFVCVGVDTEACVCVCVPMHTIIPGEYYPFQAFKLTKNAD